MVLESLFIRATLNTGDEIDISSEINKYDSNINNFININIAKYDKLIRNAKKILSKNSINYSSLVLYIGYLDLSMLNNDNIDIPIKVYNKTIKENQYKNISKNNKSAIQYSYDIVNDKLFIDEYFGDIRFSRCILDGNNIPVEYIDNDVKILYDEII